MSKTLLDSSLLIEDLYRIADHRLEEKDTLITLVSELKPYLQQAKQELLSPRPQTIQNILAEV